MGARSLVLRLRSDRELKQRIIQISHWTLVFVLAALSYAVVFVLVTAVTSNLPPLPLPVHQAVTAGAAAAAFVLVAAGAAPAPRKVRVSLTVALVPVLPYALAWRSGLSSSWGALFGVACAVLFFRLRNKPAQAAVPAVIPERLPHRQPQERTTANATELRLSDGWVLALASTGSYALAFAYEAGFDSFYGIPPSLISLNLTTAFVAAAAGISALAFLLLLFHYLWTPWGVLSS